MPLDNRDYMREERSGPGLSFNLSPLKLILIANIVVFVFQYVIPLPFLVEQPAPGSDRILAKGALSWYALSEGRVWTLVTHMFVHGNLLHLAMNLLIIFMIGRLIEPLLGPKQFLALYFISGLAGAAAQLFFYKFMIFTDVPMVGASGAGSGILLAFTTIYPDRVLMLLFPIPMRLKARTLGLAALILSGALVLYQVIAINRGFGDGGGIAHMAHLGGAVAGMLFVRVVGYGGGTRKYSAYEPPKPTRSERRAEKRANKKKIVDAKVVESEDFVSSEIDPILDKINRDGMGSLTDKERETLRKGQKRIAKRVDRGR